MIKKIYGTVGKKKGQINELKQWNHHIPNNRVTHESCPLVCCGSGRWCVNWGPCCHSTWSFQTLVGARTEQREKTRTTWDASLLAFLQFCSILYFFLQLLYFSSSSILCLPLLCVTCFPLLFFSSTSVAGHVTCRLWWPGQKLSAGHTSERNSVVYVFVGVCVWVLVRAWRGKYRRSGFSEEAEFMCARVGSGAHASSITLRGISTTKRLQSNRPINLISARICQSK